MSAAMCTRTNRPLQDFLAWKSFGTARLWTDIQANPSLAGELLAQHLSSLGLVAPSEPTSADVASALVVAMFGPTAAGAIHEAEIRKQFLWFKAARQACIPSAVTTAYVHSAVNTACVFVVCMVIADSKHDAGPHQAASAWCYRGAGIYCHASGLARGVPAQAPVHLPASVLKGVPASDLPA